MAASVAAVTLFAGLTAGAALPAEGERRAAGGDSDRLSLVRVQVESPGERQLLDSLGLETTDGAGPHYADVLLAGPDDRERLAWSGLENRVLVANLTAASERDRAADRRYARLTPVSALPSGRTSYRTLADYESEINRLAIDNPDLVRPLTLPHTTYEGRSVRGIEITTDPNQIRDGKPVFLQMGLHHAREWPSGEHAMEWAYELIQGYRSGDPELRPLVEATRTIVVPVVNPDGFNLSRNAAGTDSSAEFQRKNCRQPGTETGVCVAGSGGFGPGVDVNRNYGTFWGGNGASGNPSNETYRGSGPFSEPESRNIRHLVAERPVVTAITNHTTGGQVLRPPGSVEITEGAPDEPLYEQLGAELAAENGYSNVVANRFAETSGITEDWSYFATGGLGFTFEIGNTSFHPPFEEVVAEYVGESSAAQSVGGGGNRAAYLAAQQSTANLRRHSLLTGTAPPGALIRVERRVQTPTWLGETGRDGSPEPASVSDRISTELVVGTSGRFELHINPSTSPIDSRNLGRAPDGGPAQGTTTFGGGPATTSPSAGCGFLLEDPGCWNDHAFVIDAASDNEAATVRIEWPDGANDWDLEVYRDTDGDGSSADEPGDARLGSSFNFGPDGNEETVRFTRPQTASGKLEPGPYVARVFNREMADPATAEYSGEIAFEGPRIYDPATRSAWTLTCALDGSERHSEEIKIDRGEAIDLSLAERCGPAPEAEPETPPADPPPGGDPDPEPEPEPPPSLPPLGRCTASADGPLNLILGTEGADTLVGTPAADAIRARRGSDTVFGRGGPDCVAGAKGRDVLRGNDGDDLLLGASGGDEIIGAAGADIIRGGGGDDRARGGPGDDVLRGGSGDDELRGSRGRNRFLCGAGRDRVLGADADDFIADSCEWVRRR